MDLQPWVGFGPPEANVASDLYPGHPPANFYNPVSLRLSLPRQSILISVGHVLVDLQGDHNIFLGNSLVIHSRYMARSPQSTGFYYNDYCSGMNPTDAL